MSARKNKGLGASWANKNVQKVEQAATAKLTDIQNAQKALEAQRKALQREQQAQQVNLSVVMLDQVLTHGDTQPRVQMDEATWQEYAERMLWDDASSRVLDPEGQQWPGLHLVAQGDQLWLADGFHRLHAAKQAGLTQFQAIIETGTQRDAIQMSLGANARHGKRRTNADKRRAVERALLDDQWVRWTDARIARLCYVTSSLVSKVRTSLEQTGEITYETILHGEDGREFEREVPVEVAPKAKREATKSKVAAKPNSEATHTTRLKRFSDLGRSKSVVDILVAYPANEKDWQHLLKAAQKRIADGGCLVVPVMSGSSWFWKGPQMMDRLTQEHNFQHPQLVHIQRFSRQYIVWRHNREGVLEHVADASELTQVNPANILVVGMALDDWAIEA